MGIRSLVGRGRGLLRNTLKFRDACYCVNTIRVASSVDCSRDKKTGHRDVSRLSCRIFYCDSTAGI